MALYAGTKFRARPFEGELEGNAPVAAGSGPRKKSTKEDQSPRNSVVRLTDEILWGDSLRLVEVVTVKEKTGQTSVGGRQLPPNDQVIGRTETAEILGCSKSTTRRMQKRGALTATLKVGGASWFDRAMVLRLALELALEKKERETVARKASATSSTAREKSRRSDDSRDVFRAPAAARRTGRKEAPEPAPPSARPARKALAPVPVEWLADDFKTLDELEDNDNDNDGPESPEKPKPKG